MYIADTDRKEWLQHRMESARNTSALDVPGRKRVLEKLVEAESFERFLHTKYIGHKRFSLEGGEGLIPLLDRLLNDRPVGRSRDVIGLPTGVVSTFRERVGKLGPISRV